MNSRSGCISSRHQSLLENQNFLNFLLFRNLNYKSSCLVSENLGTTILGFCESGYANGSFSNVVLLKGIWEGMSEILNVLKY